MIIVWLGDDVDYDAETGANVVNDDDCTFNKQIQWNVAKESE